MTMRSLYLILIILAIGDSAFAQTRTATEVNREKAFLEAKQLSLIGKTEAAITAFEAILQDQPNNAAAAFELGRLYQTEEQPQEAIRLLRLAHRLDPANTWYTRYLADLHMLAGNYQEGAELYEALAGQEPDNEELYFRWAYFLLQDRDLDGAIKVYDQLEDRLGLTPEISKRRHSVYVTQGDTKRAAKELERLIEAFPQTTEYRHLLASFYLSNDEATKARKIYAEILEINPEDARAQLALSAEGSQRKSTEGEYLAALAPLFERTDIGIDPKIAKLLPFIEQVAETGDVALADEALALTDILARIHASEAKVYSAAGDLLFNSGRYQRAAEQYALAVDLNPRVFPVWEQWLAAHYYSGNTQALTEAAENTLDVYPNQPIVYYYYALGEIARSDYDMALDLLDQATMMSGRAPQLQGRLTIATALAQALAGQAAVARATLDQVTTVPATDPLYLATEAQVQLGEGQTQPAATAGQQASSAVPADRYLQWLYARTLTAADRSAEAQALLQPWIEATETGGLPAALELYGDLLAKQEQSTEAVTYWKRAQAAGSQSKGLRRKISEGL
jgi:tetratricopeptide (TPR) repeat protein